MTMDEEWKVKFPKITIQRNAIKPDFKLVWPHYRPLDKSGPRWGIKVQRQLLPLHLPCTTPLVFFFSSLQRLRRTQVQCSADGLVTSSTYIAMLCAIVQSILMLRLTQTSRLYGLATILMQYTFKGDLWYRKDNPCVEPPQTALD